MNFDSLEDGVVFDDPNELVCDTTRIVDVSERSVAILSEVCGENVLSASEWDEHYTDMEQI